MQMLLSVNTGRNLSRIFMSYPIVLHYRVPFLMPYTESHGGEDMYWHDTGPYGGKNYKPFKQRGRGLLAWLLFTIGSSLIGFIWIIVGGPQRLLEQLGATDFPAL